MAWELVYTSAPRGLAEGSRGFCTVAATRGMPASLIPRIEALSGYRPAFGPEALTHTVHPVQHTHVRLDHAGQTLCVLSRIVHAGHDYSGRTNKLAHHLVLEPHEQHACLHANPAGWIRQFDGWLDRWTDEPHTLEPRVTLPVASSPPACDAWARAAGDAGYAGLLAERFLLDPSRPTYLLHDPAIHDALALLDEANALLPNESRWHATFATYFTDPLPESGVAWRFVVTGTPAARQLGSATAASNIIDLLRPLPELASTRYIDLARGIAAAQAVPSHSPERSAEGVERASLRTAAIAAKPPSIAAVESAEKLVHTPQSSSNAREDQASKRRHRVPTAWFWAALGGWPIAVVAVVWAAWPNASESPVQPLLSAAPKAAVTPGSLTDAETRERLPSLQAELRAAPSHSDHLAAQLATSLADVPQRDLKRSEAHSATNATVAQQANSPLVPAPSSPVFSEPVAPSPLQAASTDRDHVWPTWVSADLPAPVLQSSGAVGMGSLATLQSTQFLLLESSAMPDVDAVHLRPAALDAAASSNLTWRAVPLGHALHIVHADALGGTRSLELGRAQWQSKDNTRHALRWRWLPAQLDGPQAEPLEAIRAEASLSVWQLRDAQGRTLSSVQGFEPARAEVQIGGPGSAFLHRTPAKAVGVTELHMTVEGPSETWFHEEAKVSDRFVLRGPGEATLELALADIPRTGVVLTAAWRPGESQLQKELETLRGSVAADRAWLESWTRLEEERRRLVATLPRNAQGEIDDARRSDPALLDSFARLDALADERGRLRDLHAADPDDRREALTQREQQLAQRLAAVEAIASFPSCRVTVSLTSSGARLAEVEVRR